MTSNVNILLPWFSVCLQPAAFTGKKSSAAHQWASKHWIIENRVQTATCEIVCGRPGGEAWLVSFPLSQKYGFSSTELELCMTVFSWICMCICGVIYLLYDALKREYSTMVWKSVILPFYIKPTVAWKEAIWLFPNYYIFETIKSHDFQCLVQQLPQVQLIKQNEVWKNELISDV